MEVSSRERAISELKGVFEVVNANEHGHANKVELIAMIENNRDLESLLKKSDMNALAEFVSMLVRVNGEFVAWDEFQTSAEKRVEEIKDVALEKATREVEQVEAVVAADLAAAVEAKDKMLTWLKDVFESFARDEDGAVGKKDLETQLAKEADVDGESVGTLAGRAGCNPLWQSLSGLDTDKDGHISWEEFQAHVLSSKPADELDNNVVRQRWWGCC